MSVTLVALGAVAVTLSTCLAGVVGFAYGLVALPLLLALGLDLPAVVVVNLSLAMLTRTATLVQVRRDVDPRRATTLVAASLPGLALGLLLVDRLDTRTLTIGASLVAVVGAVALTVGSRRPVVPGPLGGARVALAGATGGFLGPTTSLNGVPPALVLTQARSGARSMVADLAAFFVVGNLVTLLALTTRGAAPWAQAAPLVAWWLPGALLGSAAGLRLGARLPYAWFRRCCLLVIAISGATPLVTALAGR